MTPKMSAPWSLEPATVAFCDYRDFPDGVKLGILRQEDHPR